MSDPDPPLTVQQSASAFVTADAQVRELEDKLKQAKVARDKLRDALIDDMLYQEVPSVEVFAPDGGRARVYPVSRLFARRDRNVDDDTFLGNLKKAGLDHLIKEQVNTNSLSAVVRELAEDADVRDATAAVIAEVLPPELAGVIKIDTNLTLGIRRT